MRLIEQEQGPKANSGQLRGARDRGELVWMRSPCGIFKQVPVALNKSSGVLQFQGDAIALLGTARSKGWRYAKDVLTEKQMAELEKFGNDSAKAGVGFTPEPEFFEKAMHTAGARTGQKRKGRKPEPAPVGFGAAPEEPAEPLPPLVEENPGEVIGENDGPLVVEEAPPASGSDEPPAVTRRHGRSKRGAK